jgi:hypothetical protein
MACTLDESALPILSGCPGPNELIVVGNAIGGIDANGMFTVGYGRRTIGSLITCFLNNLIFVYEQFKIGASGPINPGDVVLTINQTNVIQDSVFITFSGPELPRQDITQISYGISYTASGFSITFDQAVQIGQQYTLHYAYHN